MQQRLSRLVFKWNNAGAIDPEIKLYEGASHKDEKDCLAICLPVLISGQLGVLSIASAVSLARQHSISEKRRTYDFSPIPECLRSVEIALFSQEGRIVHTFHPRLQINQSDDVLEASIIQFILNLSTYLHYALPTKLLDKPVFLSLVSYVFFFDRMPQGLLNEDITTVAGGDPWLMTYMNDFSKSIADNWDSTKFEPRRLRELPEEILAVCNEAKRQLGI